MLRSEVADSEDAEVAGRSGIYRGDLISAVGMQRQQKGSVHVQTENCFSIATAICTGRKYACVGGENHCEEVMEHSKISLQYSSTVYGKHRVSSQLTSKSPMAQGHCEVQGIGSEFVPVCIAALMVPQPTL